MKAYSYLRFSTLEQQRGDSYRRQSSLAVAYAESHGLTLDTSLTFADLGVSAFRGSNASKGALGLFKRAVEDGVIAEGSYLLVESLDRVSRAEPRKAVRELETIVDSGIVVVTLSDGKVYDKASLSRDPISFLIAFLVFIRANEESRLKSIRLKASWEAKRSSGQLLTKSVPQWLQISSEGQVTTIPERVEVLQKIFQMSLAGAGKYQIAKTLNQDGGSPGWEKLWHGSYITKLLRSRAVLGELVTHKLDSDGKRIPGDILKNYYPVVIDEETFNRVQGMRGKVRTADSGTPLQNVLAGLAKCPTCGSNMTRVTKGQVARAGQPYLVCVKAKVGAGCPYISVKLPPLEEVLRTSWNELGDFLLEPKQGDSVGEKVRTLDLELEVLVDEIQNLIDAISKGSTSKALFERLESLEHKLDAKKATRLSLELKRTAEQPEVLRHQARLVKDSLRSGTVQSANAALSESLSHMVVEHRWGFIEAFSKDGRSLVIPYEWPRGH